MSEKKPVHKTLQLTHQVVKGRTQKEVQGFADFMREQGVVGLAIGLVIGTQVKTLVDQLLKSFVDPLIGLFMGAGQGLSGKVFTLSLNGKQAVFGWGAFAYTLMDFVIIAAIIYFTFKWLGLDKLDKKNEK